MEQVEASGAHWKREEVLALLSVRKEEDIFRDDHKADRNRLAIICDAIFWPVWTQPKKTGVWIAIQIAIFFVVETALLR